MKQDPLNGFTLLETLLAVALLGLLLLALNTFIFSMAEIWGQNSKKRLFGQHVRAVTRHVEKLLRTAVFSPVSLNGAKQVIMVQEIRTESGATEAMLTFDLPTGDRVLLWPGAALPDVVCSLEVRKETGLMLYWHSRLETRFADARPRVTLLTPLADAMSYDYYHKEAKAWQNQPRLLKDDKGQWQLPGRIRLIFSHEEMTTETIVNLPEFSGGLPAF